MPTIFDIIEELQDEVFEARNEIARLREIHDRTFRKGAVTDVDAAKQLYRQEIGRDDEGNAVKGPWVPYSQVAGARKSHSPPSVGQQMVMIAPDGDPEQAFGVPLTWSTQNASPSNNATEDVDVRGSVTIKNDGSAFTITAGGVSVKISGSGLEVTGGAVKHDSHDIGKTHKHKDV